MADQHWSRRTQADRMSVVTDDAYRAEELEHIEHHIEQVEHLDPAAMHERLLHIEAHIETMKHEDPAAVHHRLARIQAHLEKLTATGVHEPAWLRRTADEPRLPVALAILAAVALQVAVPHDFAFHPWWLLPGLEVLLLVVIGFARQTDIDRESQILRVLGITLVAAASLATAYSAYELIQALLHKGTDDPSNPLNQAGWLLRNGGAIWLTNVIVFALWYWEMDRGGPAARACARVIHPDFLFAQMTAPELVSKDWEPGFVDYLYLSFTNATAFSPTDTLPLTRWAKLVMMFQSAVSLITVALVVARAVNVIV